MKLQSKALRYPSCEIGTVAYEKTYYTQADGLHKMRVRCLEVADDIFDYGTRAFSNDNGLTWGDAQPCMLGQSKSGGTLRQLEATGFADPVNGRLLTLTVEGTLAHDTSHDGETAYYIKYRVSPDGGKTALVDEPLCQRGPYTSEHPVEHVWTGKNALWTASENAILRAPSGHLVVVTNFTPLRDNDHYESPSGVWNFMEILVLLGHWQDSGHIEWELGPRVALDLNRSTRGASEPTIALMPDGRILMVFRGGNDGRPDLPGYKWFCVSADEGCTWTQPEPWQLDSGTPFFSPGSLSQLLQHTNGKCYWLGNVVSQNPVGNVPRHPLVIGEVDTQSLVLKEETLFEIDGLHRYEDPSLALSNFYAHEDRVTGEIIVNCTRMFTPNSGWHGDAYEYRLQP